MAKETMKLHLMMPDEAVINKIYLIRGQKVMLDRDLAEMYGVETRRLNEQVKRNKDRFPKDFMFQLSSKEFENLISQFATSSWGGIRKLPFAFTEQGVAMLSGVLNSAIAIQVNIQIIRIFTKMREMLLTNKDILLTLEKLENDVTTNKQDIATIFEALKQLLTPPAEKRIRIGFKPGDD
ncbi:ORF6N domain-containing protein [Parafilimonas sp.]|uniref:ORF6N domain-containing protein n=1 Tax=Parafilimonas sp. TaxID=1969739 RepID=UPI0039E48AD9